MKKAIVYLNQFFGQVGGEDVADYQPEIKEGAIGAAMAYNQNLDGVEVTHTLICGDNYMGSNKDQAVATLLGFLEGKEFDFFFAGPAFQAGRYGVACGEIAKAVHEKFNVPVFSSMHCENPGVEMFKADFIIFRGGKSGAAMRKDVKAICNYVNKMVKGEELGDAEENGYYPRGIRHQVWLDPAVNATDRVVDMLLKKIKGEEFVTELPIPKVDNVAVASPIKDLSQAKIAVLNTGGIVPVDNPDKIQSASATRWGRYDMTGMDRLEGGVFKTIHAGFDPAAADANPNVILPLDVLREFQQEGKFKELHKYFYSTVGTGTTQGEAARMAKEMIVKLQEDGVDGAIMIST